MKIAFLGDFRKLWNEEGIAQAFESLGHTVLRIQEEEMFETMAQVRKIDVFAPDLVLMAKAKIACDRDVFFMSIKKYKTATWNFDLYIGLDRERFIRTDPIFKNKYVFTPDGGNVEKWESYEVNHHLLRQGIVKDFCYKGEKQDKYAFEVVFVGSMNHQWPHREEMCSFLAQHYRFARFGIGNYVRGHDLNNLYASASIIVGDSVYSTRYWSNRIYETLGRGGFFLHNKVEGMEEDYTPGEHFVPYNLYDFDALKTKIDYYLDRPEEREQISQAAMEHTINHHTLQHRCQQLLASIS